MDHIRHIQEMVDEHKEALPTDLVRCVLKECQDAYTSFPKLWKLFYVKVINDGEGGLEVKTRTMIVEEVHAGNLRWSWDHVFDTATIPPVKMLAKIKGDYVWGSNSSVRIVTKVERFMPRGVEEVDVEPFLRRGVEEVD